jgi:hypothetical protein
MATHNGALLRAWGKRCMVLTSKGLTRYGWGDEGEVRHGITYADCSGLVFDGFNDCGYHIPRTTADGYWHMTRPISGKPGCGDVGFYDHGTDGNMDHIVLCIGAGEGIEARTAHAAITNQWQAHSTADFAARSGFKGWRRFPEPWRFPLVPKPVEPPSMPPTPPVDVWPYTYIWNGAAVIKRAAVDTWLAKVALGKRNLVTHKGLFARIGCVLVPSEYARDYVLVGKALGLTMHSAPTTERTMKELLAFIAKL